MASWSCNEQVSALCLSLIFDELKILKKYPVAGDREKLMCYEDGRDFKPYTWLNSNDKIADQDNVFCGNGQSVSLVNGACVAYNPLYWCANAGGLVIIDINGPYKGENKLGKDTFLFMYGIANNQQNPVIGKGLAIHPFGTYDFNGRRNELSRNYLINYSASGCKKNGNGKYCSTLIFNDGWQIKNDYPW